jgi:hypothetical protein
MSNYLPRIEIGPFHAASERSQNFCHNLYISSAIYECAIKLEKMQEEYDEAILSDDSKRIEIAKMQLQAYQSSLVLTAHIFDEIDEIAT